MSGLRTTAGYKGLLRAAIDKRLGGLGLTQAQRYAEVCRAQRCRNLFFNALAPISQVTGAAKKPREFSVTALTPSFAMPVIIWDAIQAFDWTFSPGTIAKPWPFSSKSETQSVVQMFSVRSGLLDILGAGIQTPSQFAFSTQVQPTIDNEELQFYNTFVPYLLRPDEILQIVWQTLTAMAASFDLPMNFETGFCGTVVLDENEPYATMNPRLHKRVCKWIETNDPETFILSVQIPEGDLPDGQQTTTLHLVTEIQERPLLILGMGSNITGAQIRMRDDSKQWRFTAAPQQPLVDDTGAQIDMPHLRGQPIWLLAPSSEFDQFVPSYRFFPVPHFLEPMTSLIIDINSGLFPQAGSYFVTLGTGGAGGAEGGNLNGDGFIYFLCRTV